LSTLTAKTTNENIKLIDYVLDFRVSIEVGGCSLASNKRGVD
jgi:hypothetical protein